MKVVGIDPGTHRVGWGIIEGTPSKHKLITCGIIESPKGTKSEVYLKVIKSTLDKLLSEHSPDILSIETLLFQKNVKTAISVAQARGVILLSAAEQGLSVLELAPNTIKSCVAGTGSAGKSEVDKMVGLLLGINTTKLIDDTTDALAVAIAGIVNYRQL